MLARLGAGRVRHIQTRFLWVQERLREKAFDLAKVGTLANPSDLGTKAMVAEALERLLPLAGVGETASGSVHATTTGKRALRKRATRWCRSRSPYSRPGSGESRLRTSGGAQRYRGRSEMVRFQQSQPSQL